MHSETCLRRITSSRRPAARRRVWALPVLVGWVVAFGSHQAYADDEPRVSAKQVKQLGKLQEDAEQLGSWDRHSMLFEEATDNLFRQHGWDTEADQYHRELFRSVSRISPFKPMERTRVFLDGLQVRLSLTHDQRTHLGNDMNREAMTVTMKHLKTTLPIAMEVIRARVNQEPFTAEQVQRWSRTLNPMMDDALQSFEHVVGRLRETMTEEQRKQLDVDVDAVMKRHRDMDKMMEKWQTGNWNPSDWGLQNDPIHAGAMADYLAAEAEKNWRVEEAQLKKRMDEAKIATDESTWEKYVRIFCDRHTCTDAQRTQANSILKNSKREAFAIRSARRELIDNAERLKKASKTPEEQEKRTAEIDRLIAPIGAVFGRMKARLFAQVLTAEQRKRLTPTTQPENPEMIAEGKDA